MLLAEIAAMSRVLAFPNHQRLREQVGVWIARIDRGLTSSEQAELRRWLNESVRHREALFEMAELWDRMDVLREISELFPLQIKAPTWMRLPLRAIASLVLMVSVATLGFWMYMKRSATDVLFAGGPRGQQTMQADYATSVGEQKVVTLPDQSIVTLNTATLLLVRYSNSERKMELVRGEAHFQVAKHEARIFSVQVGSNEFRAVGTAFDIRVKSERGIELTVTEGRVQVRAPFVSDSTHAVRPGVSQPAPTEIMVDAGKEVAINNAIQTVERLQPAQMEAALAWKQGMIVFDAVPLEKAIREVGRYTDAQFVIADERVKHLPVSGYFRVGDIEGLISALHSNFNIDASRDGKAIVLSESH
jgi:transmembrane sensor